VEPKGKYDTELHMFCEATREIDMGSLRFLRWLAEHGRLEHEVFGQPSGIYTTPEEERCDDQLD
jgi:hypothetical protein